MARGETADCRGWSSARGVCVAGRELKRSMRSSMSGSTWKQDHSAEDMLVEGTGGSGRSMRWVVMPGEGEQGPSPNLIKTPYKVSPMEGAAEVASMAFECTSAE